MSATFGVGHVKLGSASSLPISLTGDRVGAVDHVWLEHRLELALAQNLADGAERCVVAVRDLLGFERVTLLRFDGERVAVVADTAATNVAQDVLDEGPFIGALMEADVDHLVLPRAGTPMLEPLGISQGVAVSVSAATGRWGALVVSPSNQQQPFELNGRTRSMLDSMLATLGSVIDREMAAERLRASNRQLSAYAHEAAHDLRAPLRRLRTFSDLLQHRLTAEEIDRAQVNDFAERIATGASGLDSLLETMLEGAKVDASVEPPAQPEV